MQPCFDLTHRLAMDPRLRASGADAERRAHVAIVRLRATASPRTLCMALRRDVHRLPNRMGTGLLHTRMVIQFVSSRRGGTPRSRDMERCRFGPRDCPESHRSM